MSAKAGSSTSPRVAVVLAAGRGTRMKSRRPKVLHDIGGRPMLDRVFEAARAAGCDQIVCVVGYGAEEIRAHYDDSDVVWAEQTSQRGTGDALATAGQYLTGEASETTLLVLSGDVPLVRPETLRALAESSVDRWGAMATARLSNPGSLGRVVAQPDGESLERIVEAADATAEELALETVNAGLYVLPAADVFGYLRSIDPANAQGELYLTDALGAAAADGKQLKLFDLEDPTEAFGVNDRHDLARAERALIARKLDLLMSGGVTIKDLGNTVVEPEVQIGRDTVLQPGVTLRGASVLGEGCVIETGAWLRDSRLGDDVVIEPYSVLDQAVVESGCKVGPFARLRPGAVIGAGSKIGNFVEIKNARLADGVKAGHLAYLGDAEIGSGANIGAGAVTCNYDGHAKHRTKIGEGAFIGSDTMLVAPVEVGDGATTAAGSVITSDVPAGALGVGRARQRNLDGWAERSKKRRRDKKAPESG